MVLQNNIYISLDFHFSFLYDRKGMNICHAISKDLVSFLFLALLSLCFQKGNQTHYNYQTSRSSQNIIGKAVLCCFLVTSPYLTGNCIGNSSSMQDFVTLDRFRIPCAYY